MTGLLYLTVTTFIAIFKNKILGISFVNYLVLTSETIIGNKVQLN